MPRFNVGKYVYIIIPNLNYYYLSPISPEPADLINSIKSYDHMLHQSLDNFYSKRCSSSSGQIKKLHRDPQYNDNCKSIIKSILEQEPILGKHFSKEELDKLSLLWIAVLGAYQESAELLVRSGADVNEPFGRRVPQVIDEKWTVLHVLLQMDPSPEKERLIHLITDHGADLQTRDCRGQSVLHHAVIEDLVQMTEMLLEKGADVNAADDEGWTPLLVAVSYSGKANELVPLLMKHGADIFVKTNYGKNVLHCLSDTDSEDAINLARVLIEKGVSIDDEDNESHYQPIHQAASYGINELVNALTEEGEFPLYNAADCGKNTLIETLLKHGANIHLRTKEGRTALHAACESATYYSNDDNFWGIRLLLSAGADVLAEDRNGKTPLALISSYEDGEQPEEESWPLIEALALKKALQPSIELKDEIIIERYQKLQDYFQKCTEEIGRMKSTRFIESCTFFELFAKSRCQIAALMRNPDFETKFRFNDFSDKFPIYAEDVHRAFERTLKHHHSLLVLENLINEAVYYILPDLVVKKVVHYTINCCENV